MFRFIIRCIVLIAVFLVAGQNLQAQSKKELEARKRKLQQEINYTNSLLEKTAKTKKSSLSQLRQLNNKISSRQSLIQAMEQEIQLFADSIANQEKIIDSLEQDLSTLKVNMQK